MNMEVSIGYLVAFLTTISFIPQAVQIYKTKNTDSISKLMYIIFCFGVALWLSYGLMVSSRTIVIANSITIILSLYTLYEV